MVIGSVMYKLPENAKANSDTTRLWRMAHGIVMSLACIAAGVGFWAIYSNHVNLGQSQLGLDVNPATNEYINPWSKIIHVFVGYAVLLLLFFNLCMGLMKYVGLSSMKFDLISRTKNHANQGRVLLLLGGANVAIVLQAFPAVVLPTRTFWLLEAAFLGISLLAISITMGGSAKAREVVHPHLEEQTSSAEYGRL